MAWIDPTIFEGNDPFTDVFDAIFEKLEKTEDPFGAKYLNDWADDFGGLNLIKFDGSQSINYVPPRDKCPCIVGYGTEGPPIEPRGEGDRRVTYSIAFEGWHYTRDQREGNAFMFRALAGLFFPWMQAPCPVAKKDYVHRMFPAETIAPRPFIEPGQGKHPFVWEIVVNVELASESFPFLRGL